MLMRALLVLLVVLNAGVATWWIAHAPPVPEAPPSLPGDVPVLELVGAPVASSPPSPASPAQAMHCYRYGPFNRIEAFNAARAAIARDVAWTATAEQPVGTPRAWRVVLPQPDRASATATAARIGSAGFTDYLVLPDGGPDANVIALGRYRSESAARDRAASLAKAGFAAVAEPVGVRIVRWLDVAAPASFAPASAALGLTGAPIDCAGVPRGRRYTIPGPA